MGGGEKMTRRENIIATVQDLASAFLYYDRKEDRELPVGEIEEAIKAGEITEGEIVETFRSACGFSVEGG